jgi:hypothetical protein
LESTKGKFQNNIAQVNKKCPDSISRAQEKGGKLEVGEGFWRLSHSDILVAVDIQEGQSHPPGHLLADGEHLVPQGLAGQAMPGCQRLESVPHGGTHQHKVQFFAKLFGSAYFYLHGFFLVMRFPGFLFLLVFSDWIVMECPRR